MEEEKMKKLEDLIQRCKDCKFATCEQCEINWNDIQALESLLKAYKQDEKMIDLMAKKLDYYCFCVGGDCTNKCKEHIKEYFRKKVETNE